MKHQTHWCGDALVVYWLRHIAVVTIWPFWFGQGPLLNDFPLSLFISYHCSTVDHECLYQISQQSIQQLATYLNKKLKCQPPGGARRIQSGGFPKSLGYMVREPWISVQNLMPIQFGDVEIFHWLSERFYLRVALEKGQSISTLFKL